ncbi:MAG: hypothetical protein Q7S15_00105 [bacterium]|nr:hypothetical protein [bacterium]
MTYVSHRIAQAGTADDPSAPQDVSTSTAISPAATKSLPARATTSPARPIGDGTTGTTLRPVPTTAPVPQAAISTSVPAIITPSSTPENTISFLSVLPAIALGVAAVATIGIIAQMRNRRNKKDENNDSKKCDDTKMLLEQKKKELEEMIGNWPEAKIKEITKGQAIKVLKQNKKAGEVVEITAEVKDKCDKLQKTIEVLQKRYDLCMLSIPSSGAPLYKGTIVKNSLADQKVLDNVKITNSYQADDWTLVDVLVNEKQIEKLRQSLNDGPWYMHFWKEGNDDVIVGYKDKQFVIKHSEKGTWDKAVDHGLSKNIPKEQLDFSKHDS